LLFERFLNPERISMPDFDIDFCRDRREEVISYVQQKYGDDRVAQIITFGSLQARAALRDAGRVLGMPYGQVDRIAKLVPSNPAKPVKLSEALKTERDLKTAVEGDQDVQNLVNISKQIEGLLRHWSTHAAGLVIGDRPLAELVPLTRDPASELPVTQFNMKSVEDAGLVKFDFLGLKTLTVLQQAIDLIKRKGIDLALNDIPLECEETFAMLGEGEAVGLFQLESSGMREVLKGLKPDRFEDIIAVVALYRPGPMENIPKYIARKHGREDVEYMHPLLESVLEETYGIMIYQEQVQRAAQVLSGYSLGKADILRRAMGKKIEAEMIAQRGEFVSGAATNDINETLAGQIFDQISAFAGYGFNKSHAAAYALIAWQTAWLKRHYTAEFLAALMTMDIGNTDKLAIFRQDCHHYDLAMLAPCVNHSEAIFTVDTLADGQGIRYGLGAIRNVGFDLMKSLVDERIQHGRFTSLEDFASRGAVNLNRRMLENLIKAGALDDFGHTRSTMFDAIDRILSFAQMARKEAETAQDNLFNSVEGVTLDIPLEHKPEWASKEKLTFEMEALGLYLSAHPLDEYMDQLKPLNITFASQINEKLSDTTESVTLHFAGLLYAKQIRTSQNNNRFAFMQMTDPTGMIDITLFSDVLANAEEYLIENEPIYINAVARREDDRLKLLAREVLPLEDAIHTKTMAMVVHVMDAAAFSGIATGLSRDGEGRQKLLLKLHVQTHQVILKLPGSYKLSQGFRQHVKSLDGVVSVENIFL
jgi:DNA polymerase-3 subunit alpha